MQFPKTFLVVLIFSISLSAEGQKRKSKPLPTFINQPYATLMDSIKGWSYSLDGQWISGQNKIPAIGVSRDEDFYETNENELGLDNIEKLLFYQVEYGRDTLVCVVKLFTQGKYKYPTRKKGWDEYLSAYYWVVPFPELRKIKNTISEEVTVERVEAYDGGLITDIREKEVLEKIKNRVIINPSYDRNLVLTLQQVNDPKRIRFQLSSIHDIFPDVEGVRSDFTKRGRTLYGSTVLFDYIYFELDYYTFSQIYDLGSTEEFGLNP